MACDSKKFGEGTSTLIRLERHVLFTNKKQICILRENNKKIGSRKTI